MRNHSDSERILATNGRCWRIVRIDNQNILLDFGAISLVLTHTEMLLVNGLFAAIQHAPPNQGVKSPTNSNWVVYHYEVERVVVLVSDRFLVRFMVNDVPMLSAMLHKAAQTLGPIREDVQIYPKIIGQSNISPN